MKNLKSFIKTLGYGLAIAQHITLLITFLAAYSKPSKKLLLNINPIGEANIELVALMIITPIVFIGFYLMVKDLKWRKRQ